MPKFILVPKAGQNDFEVSESIKQNIIRQCELAIKTAPDNVIIPNEVWVELIESDNSILFEIRLSNQLNFDELN